MIVSRPGLCFSPRAAEKETGNEISGSKLFFDIHSNEPEKLKSSQGIKPGELFTTIYPKNLPAYCHAVGIVGAVQIYL